MVLAIIIMINQVVKIVCDICLWLSGNHKNEVNTIGKFHSLQKLWSCVNMPEYLPYRYSTYSYTQPTALVRSVSHTHCPSILRCCSRSLFPTCTLLRMCPCSLFSLHFIHVNHTHHWVAKDSRVTGKRGMEALQVFGSCNAWLLVNPSNLWLYALAHTTLDAMHQCQWPFTPSAHVIPYKRSHMHLHTVAVVMKALKCETLSTLQNVI